MSLVDNYIVLASSEFSDEDPIDSPRPLSDRWTRLDHLVKGTKSIEGGVWGLASNYSPTLAEVVAELRATAFQFPENVALMYKPEGANGWRPIDWREHDQQFWDETPQDG